MIYLHNKYTTIYFNIINKAKSRTVISEYSEKHHIIPRCLGGTNDKSNLVKLTAREHFICHWLLTKMVTGPAYYKLEKALACLSRSSKNQERILSSGQYARSKAAAILAMKGRPSHNKGRKMENPPWNKGKVIGPNPKSSEAQRGVPKPKVSIALSGRKRPDISARQLGKKVVKPPNYVSPLKGRQSPLKGRVTLRKGIPTGRPPVNKGTPSSYKGVPSKNKGKFHWTNGIEDKFSHDCPGEGWYRGRSTKGKKLGPMVEERKQRISIAKRSTGAHKDQ